MLFKGIFVLCWIVSVHYTSTVALPQKEAGFDYCDSTQTRCGGGTTNTGCNSPFWNGGWGQSCRNATFVDLSQSLKQTIVDIHNKNRNQQAMGEVSSHYLPAKLMATMDWDQNLANMAELHVRNCMFEHDQCRNTKTWWLSGQNIIMASSTAKWSTTAAIEKQITEYAQTLFSSEWPNGQYYNWMDAIYNNYTSSPDQNGHVIGHWTEYIQDINQAVGCAAAQFLSRIGDSDWWSLMCVCNYAFTNLQGRAVYQTGTPGSGCTAKNSTYPGLCARGQKYYLDANTPYP